MPDGQTVCVRAAAPEDGERLRRMFSRLSGESLYRRFRSPFSRVPEWVVNQAVEADHYDRESLIALIDGEIVGQAMYVRLENSDEAEVAVVVEDGWQRRGIGYLLLSRLAEKARNQGIRALTGAVLPENGAMPPSWLLPAHFGTRRKRTACSWPVRRCASPVRRGGPLTVWTGGHAIQGGRALWTAGRRERGNRATAKDNPGATNDALKRAQVI